MKFYYKNVKAGYVAAIVCDDRITEGYDEKFCQAFFEKRINESITDLQLRDLMPIILELNDLALYQKKEILKKIVSLAKRIRKRRSYVRYK